MYRQALLQTRRRLLTTFSHDRITHRSNPQFQILPTLSLRHYASEAASTSPRSFPSHDDGDEARGSERRERKVPRHLIPQAYRRRSPVVIRSNYESNHQRKDFNTSSSSSSSSSLKPMARGAFFNHRNHKDKSRASSNASPLTILKRRKQGRGQPHHSIMGQQRFMRRQSKAIVSEDSTHTAMDLDMERKAMQRIEEELSRKLNEYQSRLMGGLDFGEVAKEIGEREEKERELVPSSFSILNGKKEEWEHDRAITDGLSRHAPSVADLYSTEQSYANIASDFRTLIIGLCGVAECICNKKRIEISKRNDIAGTTDGNPDRQEERAASKDYECVVLKAENHLEAFETFHRNRVQAVERGKMRLEEAAREREGGNNPKMLQEVGSFLRGVFANPLLRSNTDSSDFDESWKRADGSKSTASDATELGEITQSNLDDLIRCHKNADLCPDISLYEHVLSANHAAYCFGKQAKLDATERSNRLLTRWISLHCLQKRNHSPAGGDESNLSSSQSQLPVSPQDDAIYPEQRLFHLVMRQNTDLWTKEGSQRTEEWLRRMQSLHQAGHIHCGPDLHAYNLVLLSYCNMCKSVDPKPQTGGGGTSNTKYQGSGTSFSTYILGSTRNYVLDGVEKLLLELNDLNGIEINVLSLNLSLNAILRAGRNEADLCQKTDRLLCKVLGEDNFNRLIDEIYNTNADSLIDNKLDLDLKNKKSVMADSSKSSVEPDLDTYRYLVDIYSASGDLFYILRAITLLKKMIRLRIATDSNSNEMNGDTRASSIGTFNGALRALQCKVDELSRLSHSKDDYLELLSEKTLRELQFFSPHEIAKSVTQLVDDLVQFDSSLPTRVTFLFIMQIWSRSGSVDAGDQAEKILSRMEVMSSYHQIRPFSNAYKLVLICWLASAKAGRPGAVERAHRLLDIMEAQSGDHAIDILSNDITEGTDNILGYFDIFDKSIDDYTRFYPVMFKICAATHRKQDAAAALDILFDTYGKMIRRGIKPTAKTFESMYITAKNFLRHHPDHPEDEKQRLLGRVLYAAGKHNVSHEKLKRKWQHLRMAETGQTGDNNPEEIDSVEEAQDDSLFK